MKNKGFSLVELIVVIAIMAILVGVAVPVYTSYIEKSQKSKDEQMIDEIKHALEIAAVGDSWYQTVTPGSVGTIVLTTNGAAVVNDADSTNKPIEAALIATFGSLDNLTLSYDGWKGGLAGNAISNVVNSNYYGNTDALLSDIQTLTNAVKDINGLQAMVGGTGFDTFLQGLAAKGYDTTDPQVIANAAVLYVADRAVENTKAEPDADGKTFEDRFVASWKAGAGTVMTAHLSDLGKFGAMAAAFAHVEATVNGCACDNAACVAAGTCSHGKCTAIRGCVAPYMDPTSESYFGAGITTAEDAEKKLEPLVAALTEHVNSCSSCGTYFSEYENSADSTNDAKAYLALLGQVNNSQEKLLGDIANENMYSGDTVTSMVDGYVSSAAALKQLQDNGGIVEGAVVISVAMDANGVLTLIAYPMDLEK